MTMYVSIQDMQFIGCGPVAIAHVHRFLLIDSIFQILPWAGKQLMLNEVANASILRSSFISHEIGIGYTMVCALRSVINITNSTFSNGRASNGGVMDISSSKLIVTYSIFVNNQVFSNGGVITMIKSLFQVYRSLFVNNTAAYAGGVLHSTYSSFNIIDCYFRANYAQYSGGVVDAKTSTFIIMHQNLLFQQWGSFWWSHVSRFVTSSHIHNYI